MRSADRIARAASSQFIYICPIDKSLLMCYNISVRKRGKNL